MIFRCREKSADRVLGDESITHASGISYPEEINFAKLILIQIEVVYIYASPAETSCYICILKNTP
jgi:hypothetical protein